MICCPVCTASTTERAANLSQCDACTHIFQTDLLVNVDYGPAYGKRTYENYPEDTSYLRAGYVIGRAKGGIGSTVLDVGYGNGTFLRVMRRAGWGIWGCDVHGQDRGIPPAALVDDRSYTAVTFFDSLEHFSQFDALMGLRCENIFITIPETPKRLLEQPAAWKHFKPGEHLHYFSRKSLNWLMSRAGFFARDTVVLEDTTRGPGSFLGETMENTRTYHFSP